MNPAMCEHILCVTQNSCVSNRFVYWNVFRFVSTSFISVSLFIYVCVRVCHLNGIGSVDIATAVCLLVLLNFIDIFFETY